MQHYTISPWEQFPLTCAGNNLFHKLGFHLLDVKTLWKCPPEVASWLLSLAYACSVSLTRIKLAILNPKNCISHCDLWFTSCNMRGLWHTEAEMPQMPPTGHFYKKNVRGGKRSSTSKLCSSSFCLSGVNTHTTHSFYSSPCAIGRKSSARGFAGQGWTASEYLKASADEAGGRLCNRPDPWERECCFLPRESGRFVQLSRAIQEGEEQPKSWNLSSVRRQSCNRWACFRQTAPPLPAELHTGTWATHKTHSHPQTSNEEFLTWEKGLIPLPLNDQEPLRRLWSIS